MQEVYQITTDLGRIEIRQDAMGAIVAQAAAPFKGRVLVATKRGKVPGPAERYGVDADASCLEVWQQDDTIALHVYVLVRFGTSIRLVTETMAQEICQGIQALIGKKPAVVTIHVVGTMARRVIRRDIQVRKEYEH